MAEITAAIVKELRERTNVGMMDCKKALVECNGDMEEAIKYLREKGLSKAAAKASREAREGIIYSYIHPNNRVGVMIELNCETDFVARTENFISLAKNISMQIAATNPASINAEDIDPELIASEREIARAKAVNEGKPEAILEKIVDGHIQKFCKENALLDQEYIKDPNMTVRTLLNEAISSMGENIVLARFARFSIG